MFGHSVGIPEDFFFILRKIILKNKTAVDEKYAKFPWRQRYYICVWFDMKYELMLLQVYI